MWFKTNGSVMNNLALNQISRYNPYFCSYQNGQIDSNAQDTSKYWLREQQHQIKTETTETTETSQQPTQTVSEEPFFNNIEPDAATNAAGTAAILRLVQQCLEWLSEMCARMLMRGEEFASAADVKRVANTMKVKNGLSAKIHYIDDLNKSILKGKFPGLAESLDTVASGKNAFYTSKGNFVVAPKSKPSLILHELGHATNFEKSKLFRGLQKLRVLGMFAPMTLAFLNDITGKRKDGKESFIEKNAGIIGFSAFLPTIIEEAAASIRGIKAAKNTLPNIKLGALKRNYFFAWLTYVIAGVGVGVASKLAITDRIRQKLKKES